MKPPEQMARERLELWRDGKYPDPGYCAGSGLFAKDVLTILAGYLAAQREGGWRPTHRHVKRGSEYQVIYERASVQAATPVSEGKQVTVYVAKDGTPWVRPVEEFGDGRFLPINHIPPSSDGAGS